MIIITEVILAVGTGMRRNALELEAAGLNKNDDYHFPSIFFQYFLGSRTVLSIRPELLYLNTTA